MKVTQMLFLGYQGRISRLLDESLEQPIIELDVSETLLLAEQCALSVNEKMPMDNLMDFFQTAYRRWGKYGSMGDIISVAVSETSKEYIYSLNFIGRLAFHKPGLAADLLVLIETKTSNYFVGIKRKNDPGRGKLAFPGGFININGYHLDTPLETIIHEAEEEINLKIKIDREVDLKNYSPVNALATVDYFGQDLKGEIMFLDIYETGDNEKMPSTGLKRVYTTSVFALLLDMTSLGINEAKLNNWLKAGDDASDLMIIDLDDNRRLEFGLKHHQQIYDENIDQLLSMLSND